MTRNRHAKKIEPKYKTGDMVECPFGRGIIEQAVDRGTVYIYAVITLAGRRYIGEDELTLIDTVASVQVDHGGQK